MGRSVVHRQAPFGNETFHFQGASPARPGPALRAAWAIAPRAAARAWARQGPHRAAGQHPRPAPNRHRAGQHDVGKVVLGLQGGCGRCARRGAAAVGAVIATAGGIGGCCGCWGCCHWQGDGGRRAAARGLREGRDMVRKSEKMMKNLHSRHRWRAADGVSGGGRFQRHAILGKQVGVKAAAVAGAVCSDA